MSLGQDVGAHWPAPLSNPEGLTATKGEMCLLL